jgi:hypothetical protein
MKKKNGVCCASSEWREKSTVCRQELQRVTNMLRWLLVAFGQVGNVYSIFHSTGWVLLDYLPGYYHGKLFSFFFH